MSANNAEMLKLMTGQIFTSVTTDGSEYIDFTNAQGTFRFMHQNDCCEEVSIESIVGDLKDLENVPLRVAEEITSEETPANYKHEYEPDSQTWTFYKFATINGYVDVRWLGTSNGYYSESISIIFSKP